MAKKLTAAQETAIKMLFEQGDLINRNGQKKVSAATIEALVKQGIFRDKGNKNGMYYRYELTDSGLQLAYELFGSNEPDPDPTAAPDSEDTSSLYADFVREQYARADAEDIAELNSEPLPVVAENAPAETVAPKPVSEMTPREKLEIIDSIRTDLEAWKAKQKPAIQWYTIADLPKVGNEHRYWNQQTRAYVDNRLYTTTIKPRTSAPMPRRQAKQARVVCLPNMQRKSPEIAVKREIPITETVQDKAERLRETVLEIVSHIETPLTGGVRRIA